MTTTNGIIQRIKTRIDRRRAEAQTRVLIDWIVEALAKQKGSRQTTVTLTDLFPSSPFKLPRDFDYRSRIQENNSDPLQIRHRR